MESCTCRRGGPPPTGCPPLTWPPWLSMMKLRRPYGVMYMSSWWTPPLGGTLARPGGSPGGGVSLEGGPAWHYIVTWRYHVIMWQFSRDVTVGGARPLRWRSVLVQHFGALGRLLNGFMKLMFQKCSWFFRVRVVSTSSPCLEIMRSMKVDLCGVWRSVFKLCCETFSRN